MTTRRSPLFRIEESRDPDGVTRLTLVGELDLASAAEVADRFRALADSPDPARLDLSQLEFIDSSGIRAVVVAVEDAKGDGRRLEVAPGLNPQVERVIAVLGVDAVLWPDGG